MKNAYLFFVELQYTSYKKNVVLGKAYSILEIYVIIPKRKILRNCLLYFVMKLQNTNENLFIGVPD